MSVNRYEKLVEEDLNIGVDLTWITAPARGQLRSTQVGMHSFARGQLAFEKTWDPGAITTSSYATTTINVTDAWVGDFVLATHESILMNGLVCRGHVSASGVVKVVLYNPTGTTVTPASGTLRVLVLPRLAVDVTPSLATTVSGRVYDTAVPRHYFTGALVYMTVDGAAWPGGPATTDATGYYQFLNVPAGDIVVSCTAVWTGTYTGSNNGTNEPPDDLGLDITMYGS